MKQLNKSDNRIGSLDPEKVYFVEKFGYLIKKINGGYSNPVQNVLFDRINNAITDFKTDLPNIVYDLEVDRLKSISNQKNKNADSRIRTNGLLKSDSSNSSRIVDTSKIISKKLNIAKKSAVAKKMIVPERSKAATKNQPEEYSPILKNSNGILKPSIIEKEIDIPIDEILIPKQPSSAKKVSSSILRPSAATVREEQRLERIKALQDSNEFAKAKKVNKPTLTKPKPQSDKKLTVWEKKWHKYYKDGIDDQLNGYS